MTSASEEIAVGVAAAVVIGGLWVSFLRAGATRWTLERREERRAQAAYAAAVEASLIAPAFSPDAVTQLVGEIVERASQIWQGHQRMGASRSDDQVVAGWAKAAVAFWGPGLRVVSSPRVDFLRIVNRPGEDEDRIMLRVRLRLRRGAAVPIGEPHTVSSDTRWTLGRHQDAWRLLSITSDPLAEQVLDASLVSDSWADGQRLREQALVELSGEGQIAAKDLAGLVSADHDPSEQLLELGAIDQRFARQLLEATFQHLVEAWEASSNGAIGPLRAVASADATEILVTPAPGRRLVIRDARLESWRLLDLALSAGPPKLEIEVFISAVRYLVTRPSGRYVSGSMEVRHKITLTWTLISSPSATNPWRLIHTTSPASSLSDPRH